jgi:ABC-type multidrug transport system fused ATPase/permease subunit
MIPQMPDLFAGTVRYNLDPTNTHTDADMRKALQAAQLSTMQLTDEVGNAQAA